MASPGEDAVTSPSAQPKREMDLERKRARDRKSQQAMRDRAKWTVHSLTEQVKALTKSLEDQSLHMQQLSHRMQQVESENDHLRVQNAALRLSLLGETDQQDGTGEDSGMRVPLWAVPPNNTPPSCLSDNILQDVVTRRRTGRPSISHSNAPSPATPESLLNATTYPKPNLCALVDKNLRADDDISNTVSDIIRSYTEIEALPNKVAVSYTMTTLLKWQVLLDEPSWQQMPDWLRPTQLQLTKAHPAWIDRMAWPKVRDYLIEHPEITLDDIAATYASSFFVSWNYDPSHVLISVDAESKVVITNPVFEEHIRQLKNWSVSEPFRQRFPELSALIDETANEI